MNALLDSLQTSFASLPANVLNAQGLGELRRAAMLRTIAEGLPSAHEERWKYTALRALSTRSFVAQADTPRVHPAALADIPEPRLVFVNGRLDAALSAPGAQATGLRVGTFAAALAQGDVGIAALANTHFDRSDEAFARLNSALATDGVVVEVAPGHTASTPLHLVFVGAPAEADIASHLRHWIVLGERARLTVVEHHLATGPNRHMANHLLQVRLAAGAHLVHARIQDEDASATLLQRTDAHLDGDALYHRVDLEIGAGLSRNELNVELLGANANCISGGAILAGGRRHVDTRLAIGHRGRDTACNLLWRGLASERGRVVFHGGITIHQGADGSDARLSNKNLLLGEGARIDAQPVLEIHADEVKAAHGATIGRLDPTALFYLRSRGIPAAQAQVLLTLAFCREALASIGDALLVELLSPRLEARLAQLEASA